MYEVATSVRSPDLVVQRRVQIAAAAYAEFREKGFKTATVGGIAAAAGIDKATLYGYIDRKEDLLYLVFLHYIPELTIRLEAIAERVADPRARLEFLIDEQLRIVDEYGDLVLLTYRELRHVDKGALGSVLKLIKANHAPFESALREGAASGAFRDVDPVIAANALVSMLYMWAPNQWDLRTRGLDAVGTEIKRIFFHGVDCGSAP